jgi:hypothetical protein
MALELHGAQVQSSPTNSMPYASGPPPPQHHASNEKVCKNRRFPCDTPKKKRWSLGLLPSLCYSLTHAHRSIGYRNRNPQPLADSAARLMHLRVYDSRDSSHQPAPSRSLYYSLTHAHRTLPTPTLLTITCTQVLWFLERLTRPKSFLLRDH